MKLKKIEATTEGWLVAEKIKLTLENEGEVALVYRLLQAVSDHDVLNDFEVEDKTVKKVLAKFEELSMSGIGWPVIEIKAVF